MGGGERERRSVSWPEQLIEFLSTAGLCRTTLFFANYVGMKYDDLRAGGPEVDNEPARCEVRQTQHGDGAKCVVSEVHFHPEDVGSRYFRNAGSTF